MVYPAGRILIWPWYRLWLRKADGLNNIPVNEPFILVANHSSYYDSALIHGIVALRIEKRIHPFVDSWFWKVPIIRIFLNVGECIPVYVNKEKGSKEKNREAIKKALHYLKKGELILVFPEGGRSPDGKLKKAYNGAARLALKAKVPVLPIGIIGSHRVLPVGKTLPRLERCEVKIGKLIYFGKYYNKPINDKILEEATRSVMEQIAKLIGQKYK